MKSLRLLILHFVILATLPTSQATYIVGAQIKRADKNSRLRLESLARISDVVNEAIKKEQTPGAVVLVGHKGRIVWRHAYGFRALEPNREAMTIDTVFDLASLTKVVATATSIMMLVERGQIRLRDPVIRFLPEIGGGGREKITIQDLLTHVSGFAPDFDLRKKWLGYDEAIRQLQIEPLRNPPETKFVYSDINYIVLGEVVRRVSGKSLDQYAAANIFRPLKMRDTGFRPRLEMSSRIAPTEERRAPFYDSPGPRNTMFDPEKKEYLRGEVHDPTSFRMGGVAGHAGLFSTADDLAIYCQMILNGGNFRGVRILSPFTVAEMTRPHAVSATGLARGLGWDMATSYSANRGDLFPFGSFGHTGFTGTSIWIDQASDTFVLFLSNRVHPHGKGDVASLRGQIASIVAASITDTTIDAIKDERFKFNTELLAGLAQFKSDAIQNTTGQSATTPTPSFLSTRVLNGIDVLEQNNFQELRGLTAANGRLRIGLVTNHTGKDLNNRSTIDVLRGAQGIELVALFAPEHGIRGVADERIDDSKDETTGLPIYSLYSATRRPKPEQLKDLSAILFDIQDVGARFYTYISTLGGVMEEAAKAHVPVFVLDRPNPINGVDVEGPLADADKLSFTAYHTIPVRHGLTIGELATLYNEERKIGCDLHVVKMREWRRSMWFDQTAQQWINPSPNMRSLNEATLYPGIGLLETTNLSVGRGTDTPFEKIGAPWIDPTNLSTYLNARVIPGVRFVPIRFTPSASVYKAEECGGIQIIITDRDQLKAVKLGLEIAGALRELYQTEWKIDSYLRLLANQEALDLLKGGEKIDKIMPTFDPQIEEFKKRRAKILLY